MSIRTDNRSFVVEETPVVGRPGHFFQVRVYFGAGGMNYATYKDEPRGYYMSAKVVKIERSNGMRTESYTAFSGIKDIIETATRYNAKRLQQLADGYKDLPAYKNVKEYILREKGITLEESAVATQV